uniref:uncharacterized protein LOC104266622 n=1 Tax=Ciona intestinalis TaxID=7719 RepID=UPI00052191FA|nr:uncharacterized protein LOC104266622 [Ciona intestinalis]|eukprot:XP_026694636.1 uncharacterized protein LOC104266622 [Ciona intestinalis]
MFGRITCNIWPKQFDVRSLYLSARVLNFYTVLGVSPKASPEDIKSSYFAKCKVFHPDKHRGDQAMHKRFVEVNEAYETLKDPLKRKEYDLLHISPNKRRTNSRSSYSWGGTRASPDDVWREWKKAGGAKPSSDRWEQRREDWVRRQHHWYEQDMHFRHSAQSQSSRAGKNRRKDPLFDYWETVYQDQNQTKSDRNAPTNSHQEIAKAERILIFSFFLALSFILIMRVTLSARSLSQSQEYDKETEQFLNRKHKKSQLNSNGGKLDPELELKTEDV